MENNIHIIESEKEILQTLNLDQLYSHLLQKYYSNDQRQKFFSYFYSDFDNELNEDLKSHQFISVGIFEDVEYLPWMFNNKEYKISAELLRNNYNIEFWKKIKGDGNCYYRAVLINYLELLLINSYEKKNSDIFFCLIKDIILTEFPKDKERNKNLTMIFFMAMMEELKLGINYNSEDSEDLGNLHMHKCFDMLYRGYNKSDLIEKSMIMWIRLKLTDFLKDNLDLEINGIKLVQLIPGFELEDDLSYNKKNVLKYIDNELSKMDEYVEGFPLYVTPLILKTEINIFHIDNYKPILVDMKYYKDINTFINNQNCLFDISSHEYENEINVMFRVPHYDSLYRNSFVEKIKNLYSNKFCFIYKGDMSIQIYNEYADALLRNISQNKKNQNPLTNYLNGNNVKNINSLDYLNINQPIYIEMNNEQINENINHFRNETKNICVICFEEFPNLIYFPCQDSFCVECFEIKLNEYFNFKLKKNMYDVKKMNSIEEILNILENIKKFKFVKCLNLQNCNKEITFKEFKKILEDYFYLKDTNGNININSIENKEDNIIYCKNCANYSKFILLQYNCNVCLDCLFSTIGKTKGKNWKQDYKCYLCKKNKLSDEELEKFKQNKNY